MSASVLIVGLGQIGMGYDLHLDAAEFVYSHARAFSQHPGFHLIAGVDPDEERRSTFARTYQCPAYGEIGSALRDHQPDVAVIAVPTPLHREALQKVLDLSRPSMVLCEKPLAYDLQAARGMVQACASAGAVLCVNYMRRSDPGAIEIRRRLDSGHVGVPVKGVAWYSKGFLHNGSHFFNLLEYWLGPMQGSTLVDRGRLWNGIDPEPDVHVRFPRGEVVFLAAREEAFSHYTVELLSPSGRLRYERGGELIQWQSVGPDAQFKGHDVLSAELETIANGMARYQWHVADQMAKAIDGGQPELCSGADALQALENMQNILGRT